ncbi:uncharacterized protein [Palaemon carinicauda]|uniref:uncharacterized protein n=1 Tax=Palaemon carinicauda TaxID=392227 RepID=UPI0035B696C7
MFDEKNVPEFFKAFERVATRLSWPTEMWTVLIQCRLVGKAIQVYNALEEGVARDYHKVKSLVLKAYDLVPEAYRLRFRNFNKHTAQSFVEFTRIKEEQFDDWLKSRQVVTFAALRELLLLEEFKKACSRELRVHLEEIKASRLSNAAHLADECRNMSRVQGVSPTPKVFVNRSYPNVGNIGPNNQENRGSGRRGTCYWCNKPGHFQSQCYARQRYLERNGQSTVAIIPDRSNVDSSSVDRSVVDSSSVKFLRDTGSARSLVVKTTLSSDINYTGNFVVLGGFPDSVVSAPLINVHLSFPGYSQITELAVVDSLPIPGIDGILGNDMLDGEGRELFPILSVNACPVAITTWSAARAANLLGDNDDDLLLNSIELDVERPGSVESSGSDVVNPFNLERAAFIKAQKDEFTFELSDVDDLTKPRFGIIEGLLYRFSRPATGEANNVVRIEQIVVPVQFRKSMLELAHTNFFSGHLGMLKTFHSLARYFWWPGIKICVKQFIRECETCQVMGKPNQCIPKALLHPIPAIGEPFSELVIDVVGPLPKTKTGFVYLLTIMDRASHFPEAIPMRRITSTNVFEKLIDFFSSEWDKALPFALSAIRSHPNSSTGVAPFELVFGHKVRGPLEIMFEVIKSSQKGEGKVGGLGEDLRFRRLSTWKFARENLKQSQFRMKENFDKKVKVRSFEPGQLVLVLSMEPDCFLEPKYKGPWKVLRKLSDVNFEVESPGSRRKCKVFHIIVLNLI